MNLRAVRMLLVLVLAVVGVGLYRGWFVVSNHGGTKSNEAGIHIKVDSDKMKEDAENVKTKTTELTETAGEEARELRDQARDRLKSKGE